MAVDHYGVPFSGIEPGEIDQEQHDARARRVLRVARDDARSRRPLPRARRLRRRDVPRLRRHRPLLARASRGRAACSSRPSARVRHRRATVDRQRPHAPARRRASDVRAETRSRVRVLDEVVLAARARVGAAERVRARASREALGFVVTGRARPGGAVIAGWFAAFAHPGELRRARKATQEHRAGRRRRRPRPHGSRQRARLRIVRRAAAARGRPARRRVEPHARTPGSHARDDAAAPAHAGHRRHDPRRARACSARARCSSSACPKSAASRRGPASAALWSTFTSPWRYTMHGRGRRRRRRCSR